MLESPLSFASFFFTTLSVRFLPGLGWAVAEKVSDKKVTKLVNKKRFMGY
jgi:hypothetical protein